MHVWSNDTIVHLYSLFDHLGCCHISTMFKTQEEISMLFGTPLSIAVISFIGILAFQQLSYGKKVPKLNLKSYFNQAVNDPQNPVNNLMEADHYN